MILIFPQHSFTDGTHIFNISPPHSSILLNIYPGDSKDLAGREEPKDAYYCLVPLRETCTPGAGIQSEIVIPHGLYKDSISVLPDT